VAVGKAKRIRAARVPPAPKAKAKQVSLLTRNRVIAAVGVAAAIAVALIGASILTTRGGDGGGGDPASIAGAADVEAMFQGVPQEATLVGEPDAPVTLVEYADLQCPFCAQWATTTLPVLVADYVQSGDLKIEFRGLSFIGPDSEEALRAALAAGDQGKLWNVVDLIYRNQGTENSDWVTDDFLRSVGAAVPGLDVDAMMDGTGSDEVTAAMTKSQSSAAANQINSTPSFLLGETGGRLTRLEVESLAPDEFKAAIDELLNG
jgi:protein-disulfide isomerase